MTRIPLKVEKVGAFDCYVIRRVKPKRIKRLPKDELKRFVAQYDAYMIADADVEGSLAEMRAIAAAIRADGVFIGFRCAVAPCVAGVQFYSPRNSNDVVGELIPHKDADDLVAQIEGLP